MAAVPAETKVTARAKYRLTQNLARSLHDCTGEIAAGDPWDRGFVHLPLYVFDVAWIDGSRLYLYENFPWPRSWQWDFVDMQIIQAAGLIKL
jgi:hypothetical protein